jgi:hypothetical protein
MKMKGLPTIPLTKKTEKEIKIGKRYLPDPDRFDRDVKSDLETHLKKRANAVV